MRTDQLQAILADIDRCLEGDGFWLRVMTNDDVYVGPIHTKLLTHDVLVIDPPETAPIYIPVGDINAVQVDDQ